MIRYTRSRILLISTIFLYTVTVSVSICYSQIGYSVIEKQLAPGDSVGTFHFTHTDTVRYYGKNSTKTTILVKKRNGSIINETSVSKHFTFFIEIDLLPGKYIIYSEPFDEYEDYYLHSTGGHFEISGSGYLQFVRQDILHKPKLKIIDPELSSKVNMKRPTLKWEAIEGAEYYLIEWHEQKHPDDFRLIDSRKSQKNINTIYSEYQFEENLKPHRTYGWVVVAFDKNGYEFARGLGTFLTDEYLY